MNNNKGLQENNVIKSAFPSMRFLRFKCKSAQLRVTTKIIINIIPDALIRPKTVPRILSIIPAAGTMFIIVVNFTIILQIILRIINVMMMLKSLNSRLTTSVFP